MLQPCTYRENTANGGGGTTASDTFEADGGVVFPTGWGVGEWGGWMAPC